MERLISLLGSFLNWNGYGWPGLKSEAWNWFIARQGKPGPKQLSHHLPPRVFPHAGKWEPSPWDKVLTCRYRMHATGAVT